MTTFVLNSRIIVEVLFHVMLCPLVTPRPLMHSLGSWQPSVDQAELTKSCDCQHSIIYEWIDLNREAFEIFNVALTVTFPIVFIVNPDTV